MALALALGLGATAPAQASATQKKDPRDDYITGSAESGGLDLAKVKVNQVDTRTFRAVVKRKQIKKKAKVLRWNALVWDVGHGSMDVLGSVDKPLRWKL